MRNRTPSTVLTAATFEDLRDWLCRTNFDVPLRSEGRTKDHVEPYAIGYLLATLSPHYFKFPIELVHRERPDFLLRTRGRTIGIEHVEVVPQNEAWMAKLREEGHGPDVHFLRHAAVGETVKPRAETIREIEADDSGDGWVGDSAEKEWAEAVAHHALAKVERASQPGIETLDETWLLMYDNWPLPAVDPRKAAAYFLARDEAAAVLERFERVLVMDDQRLWEFGTSATFHRLRKPNRERE